MHPLTSTNSGRGPILVVGTMDTKAEELVFVRDCVAAEGLDVVLVDVSTSGQKSKADVSAETVRLELDDRPTDFPPNFINHVKDLQRTSETCSSLIHNPMFRLKF